jgi:hypothetical protein
MSPQQAPFHPNGGCSKYPEETELLASSEGLALGFQAREGQGDSLKRTGVSWKHFAFSKIDRPGPASGRTGQVGQRTPAHLQAVLRGLPAFAAFFALAGGSTTATATTAPGANAAAKYRPCPGLLSTPADIKSLSIVCHHALVPPSTVKFAPDPKFVAWRVSFHACIPVGKPLCWPKANRSRTKADACGTTAAWSSDDTLALQLAQ